MNSIAERALDLKKQELRRASFEAAYPFSDLYCFVKDRYIATSVRPSAACLAGVDQINEAWFYWNAALDSVIHILPTPLQGGVGTPVHRAMVRGFNACLHQVKSGVLDGETISKSRLESLRKDAERYRRYRRGFVDPASLDRSIDEAIAAHLSCGGPISCQLCADEGLGVKNG